MELLSTYHLKKWVMENEALFQPPHRTNRVLLHHRDFIVMILRGPNVRLDFHVEQGEEFFYQIEGDMELHIKPPKGNREVVKIREGEIFLCPGGLPHSPRRGSGTWGLVIERKRSPEEVEEFVWFCEKCDERVHSQGVVQGDMAAQVGRLYGAFNSDLSLRTCANCRYVFPQTPMAERLGFLETKR